jgi:hypothetical protein
VPLTLLDLEWPNSSCFAIVRTLEARGVSLFRESAARRNKGIGCYAVGNSQNTEWVEQMFSRMEVRLDYYAGGVLILIGSGAIYEASSLNLGTLMNMGPGFMPISLGVILTIIGVVIAGTAAASDKTDIKDTLPPPEWRGWLCVVAGPILFIFFGAYTGLVPAVFACVFVSALGDRTATLKSSAVLAFGTTVVGVILFSCILGISFPLLRWGAR